MTTMKEKSLIHIASYSGGKDSTAMILKLLENKMPLDLVYFFDLGKEYKSIYRNVNRMEAILAAHGIELIRAKPAKGDFNYYFSDHETTTGRKGYGWCGGSNRWGTNLKISTARKLENELPASVKVVVKYIGIAADEAERVRLAVETTKTGKKIIYEYPLATWGIKEDQALVYCYRNGFHWLENGLELYDYLTRVSCYCCHNNSLNELRFIYFNLPEYWHDFEELERKNPTAHYRGRGMAAYKARFEQERANGLISQDERGAWVLTPEFLRKKESALQFELIS